MNQLEEIRCVCFDLDDTLTKDIHSVMVLCILNGRLPELMEIESEEAAGRLHWIEADHRKARLVKGLAVHRVQEEFLDIARPLKNVAQTMGELHRRGLRCIVITAGPVQVAEAARSAWGLDAAYGSDYGEAGGVFTGVINNHIGDCGKISCLEEDCRRSGIPFGQCAAVGDGSTDIPLFQRCANSVAINYSPAVEGVARHLVRTDDLLHILPFLNR